MNQPLHRSTKIIIIILSLLTFLPCCAPLLFVFSSSLITQSEMKKGALDLGRLAPYPKSAKDFRAATCGSPFTREFMVSFRAPPEDIERWIMDSEGLRGVVPKILDENHKYLPQNENTDNGRKTNSSKEENHEYHWESPNKPDWINNLKVKNGKKYAVPASEHGIGGTIIIDNETNTVYIDVNWS